MSQNRPNQQEQPPSPPPPASESLGPLLKQAYAESLSKAVPDSMTALLAKLRY